jgi:hypothetical protein
MAAEEKNETPERIQQTIRRSVIAKLQSSNWEPEVLSERPNVIQVQRPEDATPRRFILKVCSQRLHWFGFAQPKPSKEFKINADFVLFAAAVFPPKKSATVPVGIHVWLMPAQEVVQHYKAIHAAYKARGRPQGVSLWAHIEDGPVTDAFDACQMNLMGGREPDWVLPYAVLPAVPDGAAPIEVATTTEQANGSLREQVARLSWPELQAVIRDYWSSKTGQSPSNIDVAITIRS